MMLKVLKAYKQGTGFLSAYWSKIPGSSFWKLELVVTNAPADVALLKVFPVESCQCALTRKQKSYHQ